MKDAIKNAVIIICILCIGFLGFSYISSSEQRLFLQNGADQIFEYNFGALCDNLAVDTSKMDEDEFNCYNSNNANYGYAITNIFSYTTYANSTNLNNIVHALDQMSGTDAIYEKVSDIKMQEQLMYLSKHLNSEETAKSVWNQLSVQLQERTSDS